MRTVALWLSLILIFVIPWENAIIVEGLGTVGRAVGLLVAAFWVFTVVVTGRFRKLLPFHLAVFVFVLWNALSILWTMDVDLTITQIKTYFQIFVFVLILWDLYTAPAALKAGLQAYILGAYISVGSVVINFLTGTHSVGQSRYAGSGFNENTVALLLALGIPVALHLAISGNKSRPLGFINYAYIPLATLCILLTASRGGLIATFPAFIYVIVSLTRIEGSRRVILLGTLVSAVLIIQTFVPQSSFDRLGNIGFSISENDLGGRVELWREGVAIFAEHPLVGVGSNAYTKVAESTKNPHNTFLSLLSELGIIGFGLFVIILVIVVYHAVRQTKSFALLWLTVLSVWILGVTTFAWEYRKATWLFLGFVIIASKLSDAGQEPESKSLVFNRHA